MSNFFDPQHAFEILSRATRLFSSSLDIDQTLDHLTTILVPQLAGYCRIELIGQPAQTVRATVAESDIRTRISVPLEHADGPIGTLILGAVEEAAFDDSRALIVEIARVAAGALANARLFKEMRDAQVRAEEQAIELEEQTIELEFANEQLTHAEAEERALIEAMRDVVIVIDSSGRYVKVPHTSPDAWYAPGHELIGKRVRDVLPADVADHMLEIVGRALAAHEAQRTEYRLVVGGRAVWFSAVVSPMANDQVLWVARDITAQKAAEEAVRASEVRYRLLFESNPMPMWVYDRQTLRFLSVNDAAIEQYGFTRDEFLSMTLADIRPAQEISRLRQAVGDSPTALHHSTGWHHRRKNGSIIDVEITAHPLVLDGHDAELVLAQDITARRDAERLLRENAELLRAVIDDSPLPIISSDINMCVTRFNSAAEQVFGWKREEIIGGSYLQLVPADRVDEFHRFFQTVTGGGVITGVETERLRQDGVALAINASLSALHDAEGKVVGVISILADISARKRAEAQLQQAVKMEAVGRLAGGVAHDFNNLLTAIKGHVGFVLEDLEADDPKRTDLEQVALAADHAAALTRQLLAFSRKQIQQPRVVDVAKELRSLARLMQRVISEDIKLLVNAEEGRYCVYMDAVQLQQVLMNLCLNARDAMPSGGRIHIRVGSTERDQFWPGESQLVPGRYVLISVADTGAGMSPAVRDRIFEPFFTTKGHGKGTGLGLSTVYGIVKQAGGHIAVYSEPGEGTTFKIYLPETTADAVSEELTPSTAVRAAAGRTILVAEDDNAVRALAVRILRRAGYQVLEAAEGKQALALFLERQDEIDLVLTDVVMPEMRGHELAAAIMARDGRAKIVMMSGYTETELPAIPGDVSYIEKPFSARTLTAKISELLDVHER